MDGNRSSDLNQATLRSIRRHKCKSRTLRIIISQNITKRSQQDARPFFSYIWQNSRIIPRGNVSRYTSLHFLRAATSPKRYNVISSSCLRFMMIIWTYLAILCETFLQDYFDYFMIQTRRPINACQSTACKSRLQSRSKAPNRKIENHDVNYSVQSKQFCTDLNHIGENRSSRVQPSEE